MVLADETENKLESLEEQKRERLAPEITPPRELENEAPDTLPLDIDLFPQDLEPVPNSPPKKLRRMSATFFSEDV